MGQGLVERAAQLGLGLGEAYDAAGAHAAGEQLLVVVDVLAELRVARHADRQLAVPAGLGDGRRAAVADDDGGAFHGVLQLVVLQQRAAAGDDGGARVAVLHEDVDRAEPLPASASQLSTQLDQPVELVVVGADRDQDEGRSGDRCARAAHIRLPTSSDPS